MQTFTEKQIYARYRQKLQSLLEGTGVEQHFHKNDVIELSGDKASYVYLIKKGCVKQCFINPVGASKILLLLHPGDLFGEVTLLHGDENYVSSIAHSDLCTERIAAKTFWDLAQQEPLLFEYLSAMLACKLRITMAQVYDSSFHTTAQRLQHLLLRLSVQSGITQADGIRLSERFTHEDFAQMISAGRSTVTKLLKTFASQGYIRLEERTIVVLPALEEACQTTSTQP